MGAKDGARGGEWQALLVPHEVQGDGCPTRAAEEGGGGVLAARAVSVDGDESGAEPSTPRRKPAAHGPRLTLKRPGNVLYPGEGSEPAVPEGSLEAP